jgi:hypothetical protein
MKTIEHALKLIDNLISTLQDSYNLEIDIALVGGYSAISHGVERTTVDVDFCIYADIIHKKDTTAFVKLLKQVLPENFEIKLIEGSKIMDDPFKHDVIFISDSAGAYPKIDIIIAKYKWELEGIREARPLQDVPFPVLPKPYLVAMKLKAGGLKDDSDVVELYSIMTEEERKKTKELAKLVHKDKKLAKLLKPRKVTIEEEDKDLLI